MTCPNPFNDDFRCPTKWELFKVLRALLPRGRAWQTHVDEVGKEEVPHKSAQAGLGRMGAAQFGQHSTVQTRHTRMAQYWLAVAETLEYWQQRACQLLKEFFCFSANETLDVWHKDYGFPDPCDPYETLCEKVAAQGGTHCTYFRKIAADRGWAIECYSCKTGNQDMAGEAMAGCAAPCDCDPAVLIIKVLTDQSPAFEDDYTTPSAGCLQAGGDISCEPAASQVRCLLERFAPAHLEIIYEVI